VLQKATTSLRARAAVDPPDFTQITEGSDGFELVVPVTVTDRSGTEVVHADITTWSQPTSTFRKRRKSGVLGRRCNRQRSQPR
jgi:hypothetical protein